MEHEKTGTPVTETSGEDSTIVVGRKGTQGEGPFMTMELHVAAQQVTEARFETYGCPVAIVCGTWVSGWVKNKSLEVAGRIEAGDLLKILGNVPLGKEHCADLAVGSLHDALRQLNAVEPGVESGTS